MAQSNKNMQRRQTRAAKRAEQEAQAQVQAMQAEKERRQQTLIGVAIVAVLLIAALVAGFTIYHHANSKSAHESAQLKQFRKEADGMSVKPTKYVDKDYGILISHEGYGKAEPNVPTLAIYMDPICPGCGAFNREVDPMLISMMKAGQINLDLHPIAFLDSLSNKDTYSSRAVSGAFGIAEHDSNPLHLLHYFQNLYSEAFQPHEGAGYKSVSDEQLMAQAVKAGVSEDVAKKAFDRAYQPWVLAESKYTVSRPDLQGKSGRLKGQFSTPTIAINGHMVDLNDVYNLKISMNDAVLQLIGLDRSDIGVQGKKPSLNATDMPYKLHKVKS